MCKKVWKGEDCPEIWKEGLIDCEEGRGWKSIELQRDYIH